VGYFGVTVVALGVLSLLAVARNWRRFWHDEMSLLTMFYFFSAVAFLLKTLWQPRGQLDRLPAGLELGFLPKVHPAVDRFRGCDNVRLRGFLCVRARLAEVFAAPLFVVGLIAAFATGYSTPLRVSEKSVYFFYLSVICGITGLMLLTAAMACSLQNGESAWKQWTRRLGRGAVLTLIAIELLD
jgi:hypothetical protein